MADHDARFKKLLAEFLPEFLVLFFPERAARFDFTAIDWLDKEVYADPLSGDVRRLDLVARVRIRPGNGQPPRDVLALVHVEIERGVDGADADSERSAGVVPQ
jgi:hypothetical protein